MGEFLKLLWDTSILIGKSFNTLLSIVTYTVVIDVSFFAIRDLDGNLISTISLNLLSIFSPVFLLILLVTGFFSMIKRSTPLLWTLIFG